ncbi:ankyrin repeat-containing domain protein [Podospora aff. communis PSN243]|uniref:Ankyrin repeat-containing domain protein n=1 Tax=Podospora aff. communis PSN243 TaxID=3040156 RepID=A0AAV9GEY1_9PEZI|nr:ankyrin repeat-containing domain protein [Podospora aff. communis PSN243]
METHSITAEPRDRLSRLPNEILHEICATLQENPEECAATLAALCRTSRTLKAVFEERLYNYNVHYQGSSALFWVAYNGNIMTMEKALARGALVNEAGHHRSVSLELLPSLCPDCEECMFLEPIMAVMANVRGTALQYAAAGGQGQAVEWLFRAGAQLDIAATGLCACRGVHLSLPGFPRWMPLHTAICHGKVTTAETLIRLGAGAFRDPDSETTALHAAAYAGSHHLVKLLLETHGSDHVNVQAKGGVTPLHYAAGEPWSHRDREPDTPTQTIDVITSLVKAGADINAVTSAVTHFSRTPFDSAIANRSWKACLALLNLGADLGRRFMRDMVDSFMYQWADEGHADDEHLIIFLREAMRRQAFVDHEAAMVSAMLHDDWTAARILPESDFYQQAVHQPVHLSSRNCDGGNVETCLTATILAWTGSLMEDLELLSLVLEFGANPNTRNSRGQTPIHCLLGIHSSALLKFARSCTLYESLRLMLRHKASLDIPDGEEKTAVDILLDIMATEGGRTWGFRVLTYLLKHVEDGCVSAISRARAVTALGEAAISLASEIEDEL